MAQAAPREEIFTTPSGLGVQFRTSDILTASADALVTGQGPAFDKKSLVTEHLLKTISEFEEKHNQLIKSQMWSVHKIKLSNHWRQIKWIITAFFDTRVADLDRKMTILYETILKKADRHAETLAIPILGSGRGKVEVGKANEWLLKALFDYKPCNHLRTVMVVYSKAGMTDMIMGQFNSLNEMYLPPSIPQSIQQFGRSRSLYDIPSLSMQKQQKSSSVGSKLLKILRQGKTKGSGKEDTIVKPQSFDDSSKRVRPKSLVNDKSADINSLMRPTFSNDIVEPTKSTQARFQMPLPSLLTRYYSRLDESAMYDSLTFPEDNADESRMYSHIHVTEDNLQHVTGETNEVPDDNPQHVTGEINEVPDRDTKHETTLSGCSSKRLDSTSLPQASVHRGRPFSDVIHPAHSVMDVTTRPASEFIPRRRRRDRFKEEGGLAEIKQIEDDFRRHFDSNVTVLKTEPVENTYQKKEYDFKKAQILNRLSKDVLDSDTVQKTLWFNTTRDLIGYISAFGFNRSNCGYDGDYGEGVYFTTSPASSEHEEAWLLRTVTIFPPPAKPRAHETQYVFRAKVLTGVSKLGTRGIRVLEDTEPGGLCDSTVDDLQSPSLYVVYNDTQAYPEYLIEYTVNS